MGQSPDNKVILMKTIETNPFENPNVYAWIEDLAKNYSEDQIVSQIMNKLGLNKREAKELLQDVGAVIVATEYPEFYDK